MNKKGQALVEFVLIMPILLFILLTIYDLGMVFVAKNKIIGDSIDIVNMYKNNYSLRDIQNIYQSLSISVNQMEEYDKILIKSSVKVTTPLMKQVLGNPYEIEIERYLPNE